MNIIIINIIYLYNISTSLSLINGSNTYIRCYSLVASTYYYLNASIYKTVTIRIVENPIRVNPLVLSYSRYSSL